MRRLLPYLLVVVGCIGPRMKTFTPVREPRGILAQVSRGRASFDAELLAVTDSALLLLNSNAGQVVLVPYNAATRVRFPQIPTIKTLQRGNVPSPDQRERLRLWSRFPPGVNAELLSRLLAAYGQESLTVLTPSTARDC